MEKKQPKSRGRPLLKEEKREHIVKVKLTASEQMALEKLESSLQINRSDLIRERLFEQSGKKEFNQSELLNRLDEIGAAQGRCGNNINQLARHANVLQKNGALKSFDLSAYTKVFQAYVLLQKELEDILRQLLKALR